MFTYNIFVHIIMIMALRAVKMLALIEDIYSFEVNIECVENISISRMRSNISDYNM